MTALLNPIDLNGVTVFPDALDREAQIRLVKDLRAVGRAAPFRRYETPHGQMSVRMSGAGDRAWAADKSGYRYTTTQPDGNSWPAIPASILDVWDAVSGVERKPDSCLVNFYGADAKMGMHQDKDEASLDWPVVSISLGDDALFRVGGRTRSGATKSMWLRSGDVAVLTGAARLAYHGIDQIRFGSSPLLPDGGRLNVTLRVAS